MRFDMYGVVHKAQRKFLFELSTEIGKSDASDKEQCRRIDEKVHYMVAHIRKHSENEKTFIHPLYAEAGKFNETLDAEHHNVESTFGKLLELSSKGDLKTLYTEMNRFIASYLQHTDEEERAQENILWKHFDDRKLLTAMGAFLASKSKKEMVRDLEFMAPALNIQEIMKVFGPKG